MPHNLTRPPRGANPTHPASHTRSGHYVPAVANAVFQNNKNLPAGDVWINLQGLAIGNGLTNPLIQYGFYAEQAYTFAQSYLGKPIITLSEYNAMVAAWPACEARIANCQTNTAACAQAVSAPGVVDVTWAGHARAASSNTLTFRRSRSLATLRPTHLCHSQESSCNNAMFSAYENTGQVRGFVRPGSRHVAELSVIG